MSPPFPAVDVAQGIADEGSQQHRRSGEHKRGIIVAHFVVEPPFREQYVKTVYQQNCHSIACKRSAYEAAEAEKHEDETVGTVGVFQAQ